MAIELVGATVVAVCTLCTLSGVRVMPPTPRDASPTRREEEQRSTGPKMAAALPVKGAEETVDPDGAQRKLEPDCTNSHLPKVVAGGAGQDPSAELEKLCGAGTGISLAGIVYCIDLFRRTGNITGRTTTSDLCHAHIKPATVPHGWRDEPHVIDPDQCWYEHSYVEVSTGTRHSTPPGGTRSMCMVLSADPSTAHFVGKPTHFLSHAWLYKILNVMAALQHFVDSLPGDAPEPFFWFDTFAIDEHASQDRSQEWWSTTFQQAIEMMGHTVMMLSPWDAPQPLTRSWCLWELYCTYNARIPFSVCLGPDEQCALEAAILDNHDVVLNAFSKISVKNARAGNKSDEEMIRSTVEEQVGFSRLNAIAFEQMRNWIFNECRQIVGDADGRENLMKKFKIANLMTNFELLVEAKKLFREVIVGETEHYGPTHVKTLTTKQNLAVVLKKEQTLESMAEARDLLGEVIVGKTEHCGPTHPETLQAKGNLANLLSDEKTLESSVEAKKLYREVIAGITEHHGPTHEHVLLFKGNLAKLLSAELTFESIMEAKKLYHEIIAGETKHYGPMHVQTLKTKCNLANLLADDKDPQSDAQAKKLHHEVIAGFAEHYGATHVNTLIAKMNLASAMQKPAKAPVTEVKTLYYEVIAGFTEHGGPMHVHTLAVKMNLANLLRDEKAPESVVEAKQLYHEVIAGETEHYGPTHIEVLATKANLANLLRDEKAPESVAEAKKLYHEIIAGQTNHYGPTHVTTLLTKENLANLLRDENTPESVAEAKKLYHEVIAGRTKHYGPAHEHTLETKEILAIVELGSPDDDC
eukprot:COSAG02_NODE_245_length_27293_cov_16.488012_10_plen_809_part_00